MEQALDGIQREAKVCDELIMTKRVAGLQRKPSL